MQSIAKFLVILLSLFLSTAIWSDSSESLLAQAREVESQGQYSTSLIHLRNAAMESPDNLEVRLELVKMIVFTGQGEQAKVELEKAQKLGAKPDQTALLMIKAQFYLGLYDEIIDQSSLINLPQQQIGQIHAMQGFAFLEQRKFDQTLQMFERALSLSPKVMESQLGQVKLLYFQGKESEELKLVNQLLKQYPDHPEVLMVVAESYRTQGQYDKALKLFEQAGRIQQTNINA